jgi:autotransporter-associated beta strand protein
VFTTAGITFLGKSTNAVGTINQDGGTVNINRTGNFGLVLGDGRSSTNPTGNYNLSGTGVLNCAGEMYVGEGANGIGHFTMSGGTVNLNNWFVIGRENALGTVDISGGVFNKTGGGNVPIGESGKANTFTLRGTGQFLVNGEVWFANGGGHTLTASIQDNAVLTNNNWFVVGRGGAFGTLDISGSASVTKSGGGNAYVGESTTAVTSTMTVRGSGVFTASTGEFWVGQAGGSGILTIQDSGSFTCNNWLALGRASGSSIGIINLSSGTLTKQGSNFLAVGSGGSGTLNQTGGTLNSNGTRLGEASNGTANLSGGTATFTGEFSLGNNGGVFGTLNISNTANVTVPNVVFGKNAGTGGGTLNLDGGTLTAGSFGNGSGTGAKVFNFNGGTLKAAADSATFMTGVTANVKDGGAIIDSNAHNVTITTPLVNAGTGGLTKIGSGTVTLTGANTYVGPTTVTGGMLQIASSLTTSSAVVVSNGATLQIAQNGSRVLRTPSITATTGKIDISNNKLITIQPVGTWNGTNYTDMSGLIQTGRTTAGTWSGASGIVTSQTNATNGSNFTSIGVATGAQVIPSSATATATWAGQTVTGTDTLVMYTYGGDANLDGKINIDDYGHIDTSIGIGLKGWYNGDFNYDGIINIDDYGIIDVNIGIQGAAFPTGAGVDGGGGGAVASSLSGVSAVPEPTSAVLLTMGAVSLIGRRRRRHY